MSTSDFIGSARRTFQIEANALSATLESLDHDAFAKACELILATKGRVIVTGVGKSGHIANKIASTLSSTGTPAFFLHAAEASHGDMGIVQEDDVMIMLSKSGSSEELFAMLPALTRIRVPIIAITCAADSKLAAAARSGRGSALVIACAEEACPHDLAPTASTTAMLVLGDALAIALLEARSFTTEDFAKLHPAGALGRKLTVAVSDLMVPRSLTPSVEATATLNEVMLEMSRGRLGATLVMQNGKLIGIITDGDLRRYFQDQTKVDISKARASDLMHAMPRTVAASTLAIDALHLMEDTQPKVMQLVVIDAAGEVEGILHMHDIVRTGISL